MKRVTGFGGLFFKSDDPQKIKEWYRKHLGIQSESWGTQFFWRDDENPQERGYTAWSVFKKDTTYFQPSEKTFMMNFRVDNLPELLKVLKQEGVDIIGEMVEEEFGKFAWVMDPDGNKVKLWEPSGK